MGVVISFKPDIAPAHRHALSAEICAIIDALRGALDCVDKESAAADALTDAIANAAVALDALNFREGRRA